MSAEFQGKVALVTGGASGVGAQVCKDLAAHGASVVVADLQVEKSQKIVDELPTVGAQKHLAVSVDVAVKSQVEAVFEQIKSAYNEPAQLIVNSAGIAQGVARVVNIKEEDVHRVIDVNFKGTFWVTQAAGRALIAAGKPGSVVNIASVTATGAWPGLAHYGASKAAVERFSHTVAREWGSKGIRVNSINPGLLDTPLSEAWPEVKKNYIAANTLRRLGLPKDVSEGVMYLLSDRSSYVTGTTLEISGQSMV